MKTYWKAVALPLIFVLIGGRACNAWAQDNDWRGYGAGDQHVLHIQHSVTTSQVGFPQSLFMYHVLDGANSNGELRALKGTLSLRNNSSEFSEVLWVLAYWKGECPVDDPANIALARIGAARMQRPTTLKGLQFRSRCQRPGI